jgi:vitamin B12/bleomycin/antimicrobial peptide transport system ATP-binding/permease protein
MNKKHFWRQFWRLFKPYWFSEEKGVARLLLFSVVALTLGIVYMEVLFNRWNNDFYNSLQDKKQAAFFRLIGVFGWYALFWIIMQVYRQYLSQMLQIRWRRWLTERYLGEWLGDRAYYRMQLTDKGTDNPDQRIADDLRLFVEQTLSLSLGLLDAVVTLVSFIVILWGLSGVLSFTLFGQPLAIPGYMVWVALLYAGLGSVLVHLIGRPLIGLNFNQQRYEADFRFSLVRFRENTEGVALYKGEQQEMHGFRERFGALLENFKRIMIRTKRLTWFTAGYNQIAIIFPYVVAAPRYFSGAIQLGGLMQTASAFNQVRVALSWFINSYSNFAEWKATVDRLTGFTNAIDSARSTTQNGQAPFAPTTGSGVAVGALDLALPDGRPLLQGASFNVNAGDSMLVAGPSGSGKSTLFRAIAGIWPFGKGVIATPDPAHTLFLPQKPYLPVGTLREVVSFPAKHDQFSDADIRAALEDCKLGHLVNRLDESQNWALQLSPGEQQRLSFARVLLIKPRWLFLDEATAALDDATEARMYALVRERLAGVSIISIGHRPSLRQFHTRRIELSPSASGPSTLIEGQPT